MAQNRSEQRSAFAFRNNTILNEAYRSLHHEYRKAHSYHNLDPSQEGHVSGGFLQALDHSAWSYGGQLHDATWSH